METNETTTETQPTATDPVPPPEPVDLGLELLSRIVPGSPKRPAQRRCTSLGTPCAYSWDDAWIARVEEAEQRLQRRICGARTMGGNPCELASNHDNGRCRFHGGFALTGAPPGNRNAVIHALYSRRLRVCDAKCPLWDQCACAGKDLDELRSADRPTCPYEQTEYNTTLTDALAQAATNPNAGPMALHIAHNVALLQVMMTRASLTLRNAPLIDAVTATRDATEGVGAYEMQSTKPSAQLQAFTRIATEYRHFAAMLQPREHGRVSVASHLDRTSRALADTNLDPDRQALLHPDASTLMDQPQRHMIDAIEQAHTGDTAAAAASFHKACALSKGYEAEYATPYNGARCPDPVKLSERTVDILLKHMTKKDSAKPTKELVAASACGMPPQ